ncbi:hypothetical protein [Paenibacillus turpanensis]|uniref:hypothetical protein n=1 Tax=Paenibacillus turpanensis TaxID=2689078 RepID=UPI001409F413|nr:hypothetical protein [Paenibacillus turpanensis]
MRYNTQSVQAAHSSQAAAACQTTLGPQASQAQQPKHSVHARTLQKTKEPKPSESSFSEKISVLYRYERECYSYCLFLLGDENAAAAAAQETLLQLFQDQAFIGNCDSNCDEVRSKRVLRTAALYCLELKKQSGGISSHGNATT